ncbi:MAG: monovalent cation/H(+) antiporter subunit G [Pseudomonadota bacterium]
MIAEAFAAAGWVEVAASLLVLGGAAFCLVAAIGMVRFDDVFMQLHASTKAGTLGAGLIMAGAALTLEGAGAAARAAGVVAFLLITAPVSAHVIARAAYLAGARLSPRTWIDEREALEGAGPLEDGADAGDDGGEDDAPGGGARPSSKAAAANRD